jgi:hypothetical protein
MIPSNAADDPKNIMNHFSQHTAAPYPSTNYQSNPNDCGCKTRIGGIDLDKSATELEQHLMTLTSPK